MSEFNLFESIINKYDTSPYTKVCMGECDHLDIVHENGITLCTECGEEIDRPILHNQEWRHYGYADSRRGGGDPNRVHARKIEEKTIYKDVESMNFSQSIVASANDLYMQCTKGQIYRGGSRKAVIFACVFHAYKLAGNHQTPDNLISMFQLSRKAGLKGLKIVNVNIPKDSGIHETVITSKHIFNDIMNKFLTTVEQKEQVYEVYDRIKNRSSKLNRARPQSVSAAVIFYWICRNKIDVSISDFASITQLSELTINKNMKEVEDVINSLNNIPEYSNNIMRS